MNYQKLLERDLDKTKNKIGIEIIVKYLNKLINFI